LLDSQSVHELLVLFLVFITFLGNQTYFPPSFLIEDVHVSDAQDNGRGHEFVLQIYKRLGCCRETKVLEGDLVQVIPEPNGTDNPEKDTQALFDLHFIREISRRKTHCYCVAIFPIDHIKLIQ